jgi:hypothetical protein
MLLANAARAIPEVVDWAGCTKSPTRPGRGAYPSAAEGEGSAASDHESRAQGSRGFGSDEFRATYGAKYPNAVDKVLKDRDILLAHFEYRLNAGSLDDDECHGDKASDESSQQMLRFLVGQRFQWLMTSPRLTGQGSAVPAYAEYLMVHERASRKAYGVPFFAETLADASSAA